MNSPASLVDDLMAQLQGAPLQQMAQQLGTSPAQTQDAVGAALPLLLGALGRNAAQPQGAMDLFGALQRNHSGGADLGGLLGSLLGGGREVAAARKTARPSSATFLVATSSVPRPGWARPRGWVPMPGSCCRCWRPS